MKTLTLLTTAGVFTLSDDDGTRIDIGDYLEAEFLGAINDGFKARSGGVDFHVKDYELLVTCSASVQSHRCVLKLLWPRDVQLMERLIDGEKIVLTSHGPVPVPHGPPWYLLAVNGFVGTNDGPVKVPA